LRRAAEKLVAPLGHVSYAQAGEDLVLDFLCNHQPTGFYVDVGCNHPVRGSNTYRLYRKGWSGLCIDAAAKFAPLYKAGRPRDRFVQAAVSDRPGEVTFHHFASDELSSIGGERLADLHGYGEVRTEVMPTRTLAAILDEAGVPAEFDILSIDVEGHDEQVLRSAEIGRYRPRIILSELNGTDLDIGHVADSPVSRMLAAQGYRPLAVHWGNVFYRR
jgi:FkbM family methyltransferase